MRPSTSAATPGLFAIGRRLARFGVCAALFAVLGGCGGTTSNIVFQSDFSQTPANQPPAHVQEVGTANVDGPPGSVVVVPSPEAGDGSKWVQILRPSEFSQIAAFQGKLAQFGGVGSYTFTAVIFIPGPGIDERVIPNTSYGSVQFERFDQPASDYSGFMHLDFVPDGKGNNRVRIDDLNATEFGSFPIGKSFDVQVRLTIGQTSSAHISLLGNGASGDADYTILYPGVAAGFGAIRLWLGTPWVGSFDATQILVFKDKCEERLAIRCDLPPRPTTNRAD